jgi:hypothetical protein
MINVRTVLITAVAAVVGACATVSVKSDYDREASFARLHTYDWMETSEETRDEFEAVNPFLERRLQRTVDRSLGEHGFQRLTEGDVDFLVTAFITTPPEGSSEGTYASGAGPRVSFGVGIGSGYPYGYGGWRGYPYGYGARAFPYLGYPYGRFGYSGYPYFGYSYGFWYPVSFAVGYHSPLGYLPVDGLMPGSLVVDIVDAESEDLIWRGWADRALAFAPEELEDLPAFIEETVAKILETFPPGS